MTSSDPSSAPSPWVVRFTPLVAAGAPVLDVACGQGRHLRWFAGRGHPVTGVDRDAAAIAAAQTLGEAVQADIEGGPWPLAGRRFGAVVVTHYLWRPLLPTLLDSVADDGVLIYETFAAGNETVGKPSRADFLLRPAELLRRCGGPGTVRKHVIVVPVVQAGVNMQTAAGVLGERFGHERRGQPVARGDSLDQAFEQHRVIAGQNRVIDVVQVDLVLTGCEFRQRGTGRQALRLAGRVHVGEKIVQFPQVLEHRVLHAVLTTAGIADS